MKEIEKLISNNKEWAEGQVAKDPLFFKRLEDIQTPQFLWIGCSDSRVPADQITGTQPGQIFVHRNIANMVIHTDLNLLSVLEYAVVYLKVKHIIVCGHYNCGGVKAAMSNQNFGIINKWVRNIKDVYRIHRMELDALTDETERLDRLVELNVIEQVHNLSKTTVIQKLWNTEQRPFIHGWVYGLNNGIVNPILTISHEDHLDPIYEFDDFK
jgi:carbonic anhydrase